jgi:glycyl-tRNA synthetase beta chain
MSQPLLFEIGVEELPASFVASALAAMPELARTALDHARIAHGEIRAIGTPRRLTLIVEGVAAKQSDLSEKVMGPPKSAAFADDGTPKGGAIGFAKKLGVDVSALSIEETDKGPYVVARRERTGQPASDVLPALLVDLIKKLPFPKQMRWGDGELSFGRPIHWLLALHGADVIPVEHAGAKAGRSTRGHRFLAPETFELAHAKDYVGALREAHVLTEPEERKRTMLERLQAAAGDDVIVDDPFLVGENASLVEDPYAIKGSFDPKFLSLPDEVIIAVMRGHQRYFALRDKAGKLRPHYLAVLNTNRAPELIARGNDRVLRARLADARFFVEEDRKQPLEARLAKLGSVVFQAKLGSIKERVDRLEKLAGPAARLCKADLVTLIVGEFPELQGMMGRWYALAEGQPPEIADAIADHYLPRGAGDRVPRAETSARLAIADRADLLVGCFGLGLVPSGSADPFALRRAAIAIVRIALEGPLDVDLASTLRGAHAGYRAQEKPLADEEKVLAALDEFFRGRLRAFYGERYPTDLVDACLAAWRGGSIRDLDARLVALHAFKGRPGYESLTVAFTRAYNIAKDAPSGDADPKIMSEAAERALAEHYLTFAPALRAAASSGEYERALTLIAELRAPIDKFFDDDVRVMVDDASVRDNRLRLLGSIAREVNTIAHFHLLQG